MKKALILGSAVAAAVTMASAGQMAQASDMEKCFGVAKAGQNDCSTSNSSCKGTSTADGQKDAWILTPVGLCEKLTGGSLKSS